MYDIDNIRENDFKRLKDFVYFDYSGSGLFPESAFKTWSEFMVSNLLMNPHSSSLESLCSSSDIIASTRMEVKKFFNCVDTHEVIFVRNATEGCKLVGYNFDWQPKSNYVMLDVNHTSIAGIQAIAPKTVVLGEAGLSEFSLCDDSMAPQLVAFPLQCNMTGKRYSFHFKDANIYTLVDAASYCATSPLNLADRSADFVVLSFYKIFGFPTGLGALLCSKRGAEVLKKRYFGGGTVSLHSSSDSYVEFKNDLCARFEDGTLPFMEISSLKFFMKYWDEKFEGIRSISNHSQAIKDYAFDKLAALRYKNGVPLVIFYSRKEKNGPIINFNLQNDDQSPIGYSHVRKLAEMNGILMRSGTFCNSGALKNSLNLSLEELLEQKKNGWVCGGNMDVMNGHHTGSLRLSFGAISTIQEVEKFLSMLQTYFLSDVPVAFNPLSKKIELSSIAIYPIKSCGSFCVDDWPLDKSGLKYDRCWTLQTADGNILSLKQHPKLNLIKPRIDLSINRMYLYVQNEMIGHVPLDSYETNQRLDEALTEFIGLPIRLTRNEVSQPNAGSILLINEASLEVMKGQYPANRELQQVELDSFRANFIVKSNAPFFEDSVCKFIFENAEFNVKESCKRCMAINVDCEGEMRKKEPLCTLAKMRRRLNFGVYLDCTQDSAFISKKFSVSVQKQ